MRGESMERKLITELFAGKIEESSSCDNQFFIKIYHKASNFTVLVKEVVVKVDEDPSHHYENVMYEYFKENELYVIVGLALLRKKAINLNSENIPDIFDQLIS